MFIHLVIICFNGMFPSKPFIFGVRPWGNCHLRRETCHGQVGLHVAGPTPGQQSGAAAAHRAGASAGALRAFASGKIHGVTWVVQKVENPNLKWMIWGFPYIRKTPYVCMYVYIYIDR